MADSTITNPQSNKDVAIITVPFPAQGHLNQMLQFSCLIAAHAGLPVHYAASAVHNRQAKLRINALNPEDVVNLIHFHDLPILPFASPPPNPHAPTKFPCQLQPAWEASLSLRRPMADFIRTLAAEYRRVVVIHDRLIAVIVQDVATFPNAESYAFNCISAFCAAKLLFEQLEKPLPLQGMKELPPITVSISDGLLQFLGLQNEAVEHRSGDIYNTSRLIEPFYMGLLDREDCGGTNCRKNWAIGPILPAKLLSPNQKSWISNRHKCLTWLDEQPPNSVIYVTFGTTTSLSDEEIAELAIGLERSQQKFIWVLRDADKADIFSGEVRRGELPMGFEERVSGRGMVVREWAPQPEILAHPSTGGFMSHCGWNSCIESMLAGVPVAAWPMHSDQPSNAQMMTDVLKIGVLVREWTVEGEVVRAPTVESAVRRLMASEEGREMRKRAKEVATAIQRATEDGGASRRELEAFVAHIKRDGDLKEAGDPGVSACSNCICEVSPNGVV